MNNKRQLILVSLLLIFGLQAGCQFYSKSTINSMSQSQSPSLSPSLTPSATDKPVVTKSISTPEPVTGWYPRPHDYKPFYNKDAIDSVYTTPTHGWELTRNSDYEYSVYSTNDGGATWIKTARSEKQHPTLPVSAKDEKGFLPYGKEFHDLSFVDNVNGFLTSYSSVKDFGLYQTEDSGQTWKFQKLSLPQKFIDYSVYVWAPDFFTEKHGIFHTVVEKGESKFAFEFFTSDGGKTWSDPVNIDFSDPSTLKGTNQGITWDYTDHTKSIVKVSNRQWISENGTLKWKEERKN